MEYAERDALLAGADFVSLHLPLTPETRHFIGQDELRSMKSTAVLINMARGPVVESGRPLGFSVYRRAARPASAPPIPPGMRTACRLETPNFTSRGVPACAPDPPIPGCVKQLVPAGSDTPHVRPNADYL